MPIKYMKNVQTQYIIRKLLIKTTLRYLSDKQKN